MPFTPTPNFFVKETLRKKRAQIHYFQILKYQLRLRKIGEGWIAEYPVQNFFGFKKWIPLVTYRGSKDAFPYQSKQMAIKDLKVIIADEFEHQISL